LQSKYAIDTPLWLDKRLLVVHLDRGRDKLINLLVNLALPFVDEGV
jgi:hypothetical protein